MKQNASKTLGIPDLSLVVLIGVSGSGKSTFAREHFAPFEVLSSDYFRGLVSNDENNQGASKDAFDALNFVAGKRLDAGLLTVVDATSVQAESRGHLVKLAREHDVLPVAVVLDVPLAVCLERNESRTDHTLEPRAIKRQADQLKRSLKSLRREGFRTIHILRSEEEIRNAHFRRVPLLTDKRSLHGPFDAIGDVHGCFSELSALLNKLGYELKLDEQGRAINASHPDGRTVIFLGDLVDRGPATPDVLRLAMGMVNSGTALAVAGNHEEKLARALKGHKVQTGHGLATTLEQLKAEKPEFSHSVAQFADKLLSHLVLDDGRLVVAHAGLKEAYHGRASARVRAFALYGDTTGGVDSFGLPVRLPWADDYRGEAMVLYGHTPMQEAEWINGTMCLDTGAVFGGRLSALRYPEREVVSVPAEQQWCEPARPLQAPSRVIKQELEDSQTVHREDSELKIEDVLGKRVIATGTHGRVTVRAESASGALEVMSRWGIEPRWMPYLPPTMSPAGSSNEPGYLEYPTEAFLGYKKEGITKVICEEKHMGSRAVILLSRNPERFKAPKGWLGTVYTRTGRAFFDTDLGNEFLRKFHDAADKVGLWEELETDWLLFDAEILPWSAKAEDMIRGQYAAVGSASTMALGKALDVLREATGNGVDVAELLARTRERDENAHRYVNAYGQFSSPSSGLNGIQVAPFQLLAVQGRGFAEVNHAWHLELADKLVAEDPEFFKKTQRKIVDLDDATSVDDGVKWWIDLTDAGGEGMVVKPLANLQRGVKGLVQPGLKVRGREYLRIIYGPDYTGTANLDRLRERSVGHKRSMALREYALGIESLERFVKGEPLWRVHEAVFAVLAMESEPVDPRL